MKWSAVFAIGLASFGSVTNGFPTQGNDLANLVQEGSFEHHERNLAARGDKLYCTPGNVAPIFAVGGTGGGSFCSSRWPGPILPKTLTTYSKGNNIAGLEITYSDDSMDRIGTGFNTKSSGSITLHPGEIITSAWMAGNGIGTRLGKIHIVTNQGQTVELGTSDATSTFPIDVGSGLLIGIGGYSGKEIDSAALLFLKPKITGINIGNMNIDPGQLSAAQGRPAVAAFTDQIHYYNDGSAGNQTFLFANTRQVTSTTTISQSTTGTIGQTITFSVEFSIPEIFKLSVSNAIEWSVAHTTGKDKTNSEAYTAAYSQGGSLLPKTGVDCSAIIWKGSGTFSYSSDVTYNFDDGTTYSYAENGQLTTEQFTQGQSTCKPTSSKGAPANFAVGLTVAT